MRNQSIFLVLNLIALVGLASFVFVQSKSEKKAYIQNQRVFAEFKGTLQLKQKLGKLKELHKSQLDSLGAAANGNPAWIPAYEETQRKYSLEEQELSDKYTVDLWKEINRHLTGFGKERGYDFIFGATGDGTLMFANEAHDVTNAVIEYLNTHYEGN